jgi:glycosyltransferase involved in cell wall biosynthesis
MISIIISERGEPHNLIWTLQGLEQEFGDGFLNQEPIEREYIIVVNGPEEENPLEDIHAYKWLKKKWPHIGKFCHFHYNSPGGIYQARNLGAEKAKYDTLWFLDAHTMPVPGHYRKLLELREDYPPSVWHMGLVYFLDKPGRVVYGYRWKRDMFWGSWTRTPPKPPEYRILMNGGANILIPKDMWFQIGGYNPGLGIYGGGEPYTDIKAQMYGYHVRSHPDLMYYHLAIKRGYHWFQTDMWKNFMITSYACGGPKYFDMVYSSYHKKCQGRSKWMATLEKAKEEAMRFAEPDWEKTRKEAKFTVDEVLDNWREYAKEHGHEIDDWPR